MCRVLCVRRSLRMHPLDLSPKTNPSHFKAYGGDLRKIESLSFLYKDNKRTMCTFGSKREKDPGKRGRPRADILTTLMVEGSSSRSKIRCNKCGRVFPREKSLQAHLRTHTGERPYPCDFPGCTKAFCQSGQLKTHQRLHTGEKPFVCNIEGCTSRFTHANRHCSSHPNAGLRRTEQNLKQVATQLNQDMKESPEKEWLERYVRRCKDRLNPRPSDTTSPLDMRKPCITRTRDLTKRKNSSSSTPSSAITSNESIKILPSPSPPKEDYNTNVFFSPLPRIPSFSPVSAPSSMSPVAFPVSPPMAHQSSVTLTPITPRHPGSASSISSRTSSSSSSSSVSSSSGAVRDLSSFMYTPTKASFRSSIDSSNFEPSSSSPIITDHISHSPYYGQVLPPPPCLSSRPQACSLTPVQIQKEIEYIPRAPRPPIKRDKDRYLSALALIELSKG